MSSESELIPYHAVGEVGQGSALVLAPHPDDEVLGCAGAILRHVARGDPVRVIILTDGAGNVSMGFQLPQEEAHLISQQIQDDGIKSVVINMEHASFDQGLAQRLADSLGGPCYTLQELRADLLYQTVRVEMAGG